MAGSYIQTEKRAKPDENALEVFKYIDLYDKKDMKAGNLTIADRKRLKTARALATGLELLLLDKVIAGLRPTEADKMVEIIKVFT